MALRFICTDKTLSLLCYQLLRTNQGKSLLKLKSVPFVAFFARVQSNALRCYLRECLTAVSNFFENTLAKFLILSLDLPCSNIQWPTSESYLVNRIVYGLIKVKFVFIGSENVHSGGSFDKNGFLLENILRASKCGKFRVEMKATRASRRLFRKTSGGYFKSYQK